MKNSQISKQILAIVLKDRTLVTKVLPKKKIPTKSFRTNKKILKSILRRSFSFNKNSRRWKKA